MTIPRDPADTLAGGPLSEAPVGDDLGHAGLPAEPDASAVLRLEEELAELRDRHVRLAAEFDNFRKRTARERAEQGTRSQATLVSRLLDVLDDLDRAVGSDPASTTAESLRTAINALNQKLGKELLGSGLERIDPVGSPFDPAVHEAVQMVPATAAGQDHLVAATLQVGYRFKDVLVRPARVAVFTGQGSA